MDESLIEVYYETITTVFDHAEMLVTTLVFCLLCREFLREKKHVWVTGIVYFFMLLIQYHIPIYMGAMIAHAVAGISALLCMVFLEKSLEDAGQQILIKVYLTCIFFTIEDLSSVIGTEIFGLTSYNMDELILIFIETPTEDTWKLYYTTYCISLFLELFVKILLMLMAVLFHNKIFIDKRGRYERKEIAILLCPSAAGLTANILRKACVDILLENGWHFYGPNNGTMEVVLSIHCIIILVILLMVVHLFQNLRKKREEEKNRSLLQNQIQNMQSHIAETERIYTGIRGIRHDFNNHIHVISNLLEQKQYAEAEEYLETLRGTVDTFEFLIKTGNPVTDIIVNEKYRDAEQKGIVFHSDFFFAQDANLNVFDISVILNNALENAFEAAVASEEAYVSLHTERKKNAYLITVKNSYEGKLHLGTDGLPESAKNDREIHGFGLKNIKSVVEKYYGTFAIEQEEKEVTLKIMLLIIL